MTPDYWDSYWIVRGLLKSELPGIANDTLQNFMDEIEHFGFIPNGGRIYYLNRSQPPLFIRVCISSAYHYVERTLTALYVDALRLRLGDKRHVHSRPSPSSRRGRACLVEHEPHVHHHEPLHKQKLPNGTLRGSQHRSSSRVLPYRYATRSYTRIYAVLQVT